MTESIATTPELDGEERPLQRWQVPVWLFAGAAAFGAAGAAGLAAFEGLMALVALSPGETSRLAGPLMLAALAVGFRAWNRLARPDLTPLYLLGWLVLGAAVLTGLVAKGVTASAPMNPVAATRLLLVGAVLSTALASSALPLGRHCFSPYLGTAGFLRLAAAGGAAGALATWLQLGRMAEQPVGCDVLAYAVAFLLVVLGVASLYLSKRTWEEAPPAAVPTPAPHTLGAGAAAVVLGLTLPLQFRLLEVVAGNGPRTTVAGMVVLIASAASGVLAAAAWRRQGTLARQACVPALAALLLAVVTGLHNALPFRFSSFSAALTPDAAGYALLGWGQAGLAVLLLAPPTLALSLCLTLAWEDEPAESTMDLAARLTALTAAGGLLAAGPFPLKGSLYLAAGLLGFVAAWRAGELLHWQPLRRGLIAGLPVLAAVVSLLLARQHDWHALTAPHLDTPPQTLAELRLSGEERRVVAHADDGLVSVTALRAPGGYELAVNGVPQVLDEDALARGRLAGHLPVLLHPTTRRVLQLGFGNGLVACSLLAEPIESLQVVEPSRALLREVGPASIPQAGWVPGPRLVTHLAAGLPWLRSSGERWDTILLAAPLRGNAPVGVRPSLELFETSAQHLTPGGQVVVELDLGQHDDSTLGTVVQSFQRVFPFVTMWQTAGEHVLLLGRLAPHPLSLEVMRDRLRNPEVSAHLTPLGLQHPLPVLMLQMHTAESIESFVHSAMLERASRPALPAAQARLAFTGGQVQAPYQLDVRLRAGGAADPQLAILRILREGQATLTPRDLRAFVAFASRYLPLEKSKGLARYTLRAWRQAWPADPVGTLAEAERLAQQGAPTQALTLLATAGFNAVPPAFEARLRYEDVIDGWGWLTRRPPGTEAAVAAWTKEANRVPHRSGEAWSRVASLHHAAGAADLEFAAGDKALRELEKLTGPGPAEMRLRLLVSMARTAYWEGDEARFRRYTEAARLLDPSDLPLRLLLRRAAQAFPPLEAGP